MPGEAMDGAILRGDGETGFAGPGAELRVGAIGGEASGGKDFVGG